MYILSMCIYVFYSHSVMLSMCISIFYTHSVCEVCVFRYSVHSLCLGIECQTGQNFLCQPWGPSGLVSITGLKWSDYLPPSSGKGSEWIGTILLPPFCACTGISWDDLYLYTVFMFKYV